MYQVFQYFILDLLIKDAKQPDNIIFCHVDSVSRFMTKASIYNSRYDKRSRPVKSMDDAMYVTWYVKSLAY